MDLDFGSGFGVRGLRDSRIVFKLSTTLTAETADTGTFVRATTKTYTDGDGDLQLAAISELVHTNIGFILEPQRTNKCTNYNANPDVGLTNLTKSGDVAATMTRVLDTAELASAGLDNICTSGYVVKLDNSGGSGDAYAVSEGTTGNLNGHSLHIQARASVGTGALSMNDGASLAAATTFTNASYTRIIEANKTPAGTFAKLTVTAKAGAVVYFILNQLEEGANVTSEIITEGSATTRNADQLSYPTTYIPTNDCVFSFDWTPTAEGQGAVYLCGAGSGVTDRILIFVDGVTLYGRKRLSSVNYTATTTINYVANTTYSIKVRYDSTLGVDIWLDDAKGAGDANTANLDVGSSLYIGADQAGANLQAGGINNFTIFSGAFSDSEVVNL